MFSAVICRAIVAYELAGQKIAAKWHVFYESYLPLTEYSEDEEFPSCPLPATVAPNKSQSDLLRIPSPEDNPKPSQIEGDNSIELRPLQTRSVITGETREVATSMPKNPSRVEGEGRRLSRVGPAVSLSDTSLVFVPISSDKHLPEQKNYEMSEE
jgi:hypothetical protein